MANPKEDLLKIKEFIVVVATKRAEKVHKRLQVRYFVTDTLDGEISISVAPVINIYPWPEELVEQLRNPPVGEAYTGGGNVLNGHYCRYNVPLKSLPIKFRARRGKAISAVRRLRLACEDRSKWTNVRRYLTDCLKGLQETNVVDVSSVINAINDRLKVVQAEIRRREAEIDAMDLKGQKLQNESLLRDIAAYLGIEKALDSDLYFSVKDFAYPIPIKCAPCEPS